MSGSVAVLPDRPETTQLQGMELLFTPDVLRMVGFCRDVLGLRLSDHSGDGIAFMHGVHGSDHHLVAFAKSHPRSSGKVGIMGTGPGGADHGAVEPAFGRKNAGRIAQHKLGIALDRDAGAADRFPGETFAKLLPGGSPVG